MKLIKYISLFIITISLLMFSSCDIMKKDATEEDINNLLKAIEQLETGSYTSEQTSKEGITVTVKLDEEEISNSQESVCKTNYRKQDNKVYSIYQLDGKTPVEFYSETINNKTYKYVKINNRWRKASNDHQASANFSTLEYFKFAIVQNAFKKENDTYYGKKEEIARLMLLNRKGDELEQEESDTIKVNTFEITVTNGVVTYCKIDYTLVHIEESTNYEDKSTYKEIWKLRYQIETKYYDHDNTIITSPFF